MNKAQYRRFLSRHDLVYEKPAARWEQGAPMGNSMIGTMVWGGGEAPIRISLDRADIWELRGRSRYQDPDFTWETLTGYFEQDKKKEIIDFIPVGNFHTPETSRPEPTRIQVGRLELMPKGKVISHTMRLSLSDAVLTGRTETDLGTVQWKTMVLAGENIVVVEKNLSGGEDLTPRLKLIARPGDYTAEDTIHSTRFTAYGMAFEDCPLVSNHLRNWGYPDCTEGTIGNVSWFNQEIPENGSFSVAWKKLYAGPGHEYLLYTIGCDRNSPDSTAATAKYLEQFDLSRLQKAIRAHRQWWINYYTKSFLSIPDTKLEGLYYIEMYKLACTTRPGGMHMTLCGPWTEDDNLPAYCSNDYHWNLEQEMQLWPVYTSNHLDFGMPMYDMIDRALPILQEFCRRFFGRDGAFLAHCTDLDCRPLLCNIDNFEFNGLPWVCFQYWMHYLYSMDRVFLKDRAFPLMKEAFRMLRPELRMEEDGYLHLPWSSSPEYHSSQETYRWVRHELPDWTNRFGKDATIDLSLIRFLCKALLEADTLLETQETERPVWEETLEHLTPYPMDEFGSMEVRRGIPLTTTHRHQSHLFPIYPLHEMTMENNAETIRHCLTVLGINGHGEWVGWSWPWVAELGAYGGRAALSRSLLLDYADRYITEGTIHYQGPQGGSDLTLYESPGGNFGQTIEAGFGYAAAIMDLLLQSNGGIIRLFVNTPPAWANLRIQNLRAEGAFLVSAVREMYRTVFAVIDAEAGGTLRLQSNFGEGTLHVIRNGSPCEYEIADGLLCVETDPGDRLEIWAGTEKPEMDIRPLPGNSAEFNYYGVKNISRF